MTSLEVIYVDEVYWTKGENVQHDGCHSVVNWYHWYGSEYLRFPRDMWSSLSRPNYHLEAESSLRYVRPDCPGSSRARWHRGLVSCRADDCGVEMKNVFHSWSHAKKSSKALRRWESWSKRWRDQKSMNYHRSRDPWSTRQRRRWWSQTCTCSVNTNFCRWVSDASLHSLRFGRNSNDAQRHWQFSSKGADTRLDWWLLFSWVRVDTGRSSLSADISNNCVPLPLSLSPLRRRRLSLKPWN